MVEVTLTVMVGGKAGKQIPVPVERFLIGRADECQLRPKSDAISRNHCAILVRENEAIVRDLNSRNGTYLNDERLTEDRVLKSGDKLRIAKLEFEVAIKQTQATAAAAPQVDTRANDTSERKAIDSGSMEFDINEWLNEDETKAQSLKKSDPDTRHFRLDETDRVALQNASEEAATGDTGEKKGPAGKKAPGKLPDRPKQAAANSREAAADMLKKFFNNR